MNTKPYTFETFITTPSNRQARIAAEKVCRFPGGVIGRQGDKHV